MIYCAFYLCRKNFSVLMPYLKAEQGYTSEQLAQALFAYSLAYSGGQFAMGFLADRFGSRIVVTLGALASAAASSLTGALTPLVAVQGANGVAQSAGWPGVLKMARDWFPDRNRAVVMAWWGTHLVVGGFLGTNLAAKAAEGGWLRGAWVPGAVLAVAALVFGLLARDRMWRMPGGSGGRGRLPINGALAAIAAMYFFVKLTRYAFLFWLPLYMTERLRYSPVQAGYASSAYELVGFLGVLLAGYASERIAGVSRYAVASAMMFVLAALVGAYPYVSAWGVWMNLAAIAAIGMFTFGPDTLMAGPGTQEAVPPEIVASAGGFVNGIGSVGQILSPVVVALVAGRFGWQALFGVLGFAAFLGGLALSTHWRRW